MSGSSALFAVQHNGMLERRVVLRDERSYLGVFNVGSIGVICEDDSQCASNVAPIIPMPCHEEPCRKSTK